MCLWNTPAHTTCESLWCFHWERFSFPLLVEGLKAVKSSHVSPKEKIQIWNCSQWWLLLVVVWIIPEEALCGTGKG